MKSITLIIFTLILALPIFGAPKINSIQNNGLWKTTATWNLNRIPDNNDTIIIEANITVKLKGTINLNNVVLKIYGTLLINEGDLKLNSTSKIYLYAGGTIKGQASGIIEIDGIKKFDYSNPAILGPAYADNSTGSEPNGFTYEVLPVDFLSFYAHKIQTSVQLSWKTTAEKNNSHFEVERSIDGTNFKAIAVVFANATSTSFHNYEYNDKIIVISTVYYRLKQVDKNGNFMYSTIKTVHAKETVSTTKVYSSGRKSIFIEFQGDIKTNAIVRIYHANGQAVHQMTIKQPAYRHEIHMPLASAGVYFVQLSNEESVTEVKKLVL